MKKLLLVLPLLVLPLLVLPLLVLPLLVLPLLVLPLLLFVGCSSEDIEVRNEHDNVTCTYKVHYDFFGRATNEKRIACGPSN